MKQIADFISRVIIEGEDPDSVKKDVKEFAEKYSEVHYCFETETGAYEYINIHFQ